MTGARFRGWFDRLGIRAKLITITVVVTSLAVLVGAAALFLIRANALLENELTRMRHIVAIAADFSQAPVSFTDQAGATERLAYLHTIPDALQAYVLDSEGGVFAQWRRTAGGSDDWRPEQRLEIGLWQYRYTVAADIHSRDQHLGEVVILASTRLLRKQIFEYLTALLILALIIIPLAVLLAIRMQSTISRPIAELARVTRQVKTAGDYGLRVQPQSGAEIGDLYHGFNDMMQHIELRQAERDRAYADLKQIKDHLEERVAQRTEELTAANRALAAENAKLQQAEAALSRALTEKETLLREIHHRVKNNLQVIYSLLSLQIQDKTDEQSRLLLEDARQRVKTMALVHETLYGSADLARVSARHFLQDVTSNLLGIYHGGETGISLEVSADDVSLDIDQAIPLGLIVNELATNALKHAFRGRSQGHIEITLQRSAGDELVLQISDDGIGMGAGEGPRPSGSLGLKLVEALAQQLRGEVQVSQAGGTRFSIRFRTTA